MKEKQGEHLEELKNNNDDDEEDDDDDYEETINYSKNQKESANLPSKKFVSSNKNVKKPELKRNYSDLFERSLNEIKRLKKEIAKDTQPINVITIDWVYNKFY